MAKRDTAEYFITAEDTLRDEPEPSPDEMLAVGPEDSEQSATTDAETRTPLTPADIRYIVRLMADLLPGAETQTVRAFGQRCVAIKSPSGGILVVTSLADMRTLLRTVAGEYS